MNLQKGINLGGFLSQCVHTEEHYDTFIVKEDIRQIKEMGFDHVRLPIDYNVLEEENGTTKEKGFERVENAIKWCKEQNIDIILDLHKAYGYDFNNAGDKEKNSLFNSTDLQLRFIELWKKIANRFSKYTNVAFELLNEVVEKENAQSWNNLIKDAVKTIRTITEETPIIYGGIQWNSAKTVKFLEIPTEKNIIFTFHFYEPILFTHQKAPWIPKMNPNQTIYYPQTMEYFVTESEKLGFQGEIEEHLQLKQMGQEFIEALILEATEAAKKANVMLYCGEFGVIDRAPVEDTLKWHRDVNAVFRKYNIGSAIWSYKKMDFGFIDEHFKPIKNELIELWCK